MSVILSIESATKVCSVALHKSSHLLAKSEYYLDKSHSSLLTLLIQNLVKYCQLSLSDLDAIAISKGPGSYTGLRIGTSVAKGLCYGLEIPLIAVNTLEAMAYGMNIHNNVEALLCPMLDARRMEVYTTIFDADFEPVLPTEAKIMDENSFVDLLEQRRIIFFGNGAEKCKPLLSKHENAIFVDGVEPSSQFVGDLACKELVKGNFEDVAYFEPFYLKEFRATTPKALL